MEPLIGLPAPSSDLGYCREGILSRTVNPIEFESDGPPYQTQVDEVASTLTRLSRYKAAAIQYEPRILEKAENVKRQLQLTADAAGNGAKLIVLPEMNQVGYCYYDREEIRPYVEPIPGPTTQKYAEIARRFDTHIVVALAEVDPETDNFYNAQALIGPDGLIGKYRKVHSFISENKWAKDGDLGFPVYDTEVGRLGMLICMDQHYFETSRTLALKGADVICFSTAWLDERGPAPVWITRSFENGVYALSLIHI